MRRAPPSLRVIAFAIGMALTLFVAGCTFLISFDEVPGAESPDSNTTSSSGSDTGVAIDAQKEGEAGPPAEFPPPCDTAFPLDKVNCNNAPRANCAKRAMFDGYPDNATRANDLVTCNGNAKPTCVQHCPFGCAEMPVGFPDQCDDCNGRKDGYYCGRDLRNWTPANSDLAVQCVNGTSLRGAICGAANSGLCATVCPKGGGPFPSCCL